MPTVQWVDIPFGLISPGGNIGFNAFLAVVNPVTTLDHVSGPQWMLDLGRCGAGAAKRVSRDTIPQKDGEIIHRYFRGGLVMQLGALAVDVTAATDDDGVGNNEFSPACGEDLVDLFDQLQRSLNSISNVDGRLIWTPSGKASRMQDRARWIGADAGGSGGFQAIQVEYEDQIFTGVQFALLCPFPYGIDATQEPALDLDATPVTIDQTGTCPFYPVVQVYGPATGFNITVTNTTVGTVTLAYDSTLPGAHAIDGGDYIEFDFFRETAYLNGDGANRKSGVDIFSSDFWALQVGDNDVSCDGDQASAQMLWQAAWSG